MNRDDLLTLFDYNYWANRRVLAAAARVTPEQYTAPAGLSHGSLRGALVHILGAEVVWRLRCQEGISLPALPTEGELPDLESLRARGQAEEAAMRLFLSTLTDAACGGVMRYTNTKGVPFENVLWKPLAHLVNHGTQFRAEAAVALTAYGCSPGDLDMIAFFREK